MVKKILLFGANGLLGTELYETLKCTHSIIRLNKNEADITNFSHIESIILRENPDIIINAAAFMNADKCEQNPSLTYQINTVAAKNIALLSNKINAKYVWFSSDFVFDGNSNRPYNELDIPNPIMTYGVSKYAAEKEIINSCNDYLLIRTSTLFSEYSSSFLDNMLKRIENKEVLSIVDDIIMSPCYGKTLVESLLQLIEKQAPNGIYHIVNEGEVSWYDFFAEFLNLIAIDYPLNRISYSNLNFQENMIKRPAYTAMSISKTESIIGKIPFWKDDLKKFVLNKYNLSHGGI